MKAMILAAGRGERMGKLTDNTPKPLLEIGGIPIIVHLIRALAEGGLRDLVINHAHLGHKIVQALGDGREFRVRIRYSQENDGALETGGGIFNALPLLDSDPFVVVNGDIWTDYPFARLPQRIYGVAHLVLVDNPSHHATGDFVLRSEHVAVEGTPMRTFCGIGVYKKMAFKHCKPGKFPLAPLLNSAAAAGLVTGEYYTGQWTDVGTEDRLRALQKRISRRPTS